ncbi:MAG: metabolite traffic protein EboE [Rhodocyclaceae bacterium]|nr:metabolite traffic protein EboE [Rhodocyclaceae bacterium]
MTPGWRRDELAYCSNVHAGESVDALAQTVARFVAPVAGARGVACRAGLWIGAAAVHELANVPATRQRFIAALARHAVGLTTLNGFPFGGFHDAVVKAAVYAPDWCTQERYDYSLALAELLADVLPADAEEGSISSLPLGYREGWRDHHHRLAAERLARFAGALRALWARSGRRIRLCLEMEPGCVLESTDDAIRWFTEDLPAAARRNGVPEAALGDHLGVCFDICHQAVMFEDVAASLGRLRAAGIAIGKIQVSSALEVPAPELRQSLAALAPFDEPRYLHQVRCRAADGRLLAAADLPEALDEAAGLPRNCAWRVHFHLPIQESEIGDARLRTTRQAIEEVLRFLALTPDLRPHLEVETYTWNVLPPALRPRDDDSLIRALATELDWLEGALARHRLLAR